MEIKMKKENTELLNKTKVQIQLIDKKIEENDKLQYDNHHHHEKDKDNGCIITDL